MSDNTDKILDRVRKLLNLANDAAASEGERDNALRMAHATLLKHQLTLEHLSERDREREDPRQRFDTEGWNLVWCRQIRKDIAQLFFCRYINGPKINATRGRHVWIGRASNTITAAYMSDWIIANVLKEADRLWKHRLTPEGRNFCVGVQHRLAERVRQLQEAAQTAVTAAGSALVVADYYRTENEANLEFIGRNLLTRKVAQRSKGASGQAYASGRDFGDKINLSKQIATSEAPKQLK